MAKQNEKFNIFGVVIDPPKNDPTKSRLSEYERIVYSDPEFSFLASIIHDKDYNENGELKTIHLHFYIQTEVNLTCNQLLDTLEDLLSISREQISVKGSKNELLLLQYLGHKNNPEKHQYPIEFINSTSNEKLKVLFNAKYTKPDKYSIQTAVLNSDNFIELINKIGIENANKYRASFNEVKKDKHIIDKDIAIRALNEQLASIIHTIDHALTTQEKKTLFLSNILNFDKMVNDYEALCKYLGINSLF